MTDNVYARDLDGTGSMHMCSDGDEGSIAYTRKDIADKRIADLVDTAEDFIMCADLGPLTMAYEESVEALRKAIYKALEK